MCELVLRLCAVNISIFPLIFPPAPHKRRCSTQRADQSLAARHSLFGDLTQTDSSPPVLQARWEPGGAVNSLVFVFSSPGLIL